MPAVMQIGIGGDIEMALTGVCAHSRYDHVDGIEEY